MTSPEIPKMNTQARIIPTEEGNVALFENDLMLPVTDLFDDVGDPCELKDAVVAIAGRDGIGWFTIEIFDGGNRTN